MNQPGLSVLFAVFGLTAERERAAQCSVVLEWPVEGKGPWTPCEDFTQHALEDALTDQLH